MANHHHKLATLATDNTHSPDPALHAADIASLHQGTINKTEVRLAHLDGELWVCLADVVRALGYSEKSPSSTLWREIFQTNGYSLDAFLRRVYVAIAAPVPAWFINFEGLRTACGILRRKRSEPLREWLEQQSAVQPALFPEIAAAAAATPSKRATGDTLSPKAYCTKLADTIARYLTAEELPEFAAHLEAFARTITARRYCPGLNDAAYDLYAASQLRRA
jgi:prophage antirepressor-like protein